MLICRKSLENSLEKKNEIELNDEEKIHKRFILQQVVPWLYYAKVKIINYVKKIAIKTFSSYSLKKKRENEEYKMEKH